MGAWADIEANTDEILSSIKGLATEAVTDRSDGSLDADSVTGGRVEAAKAVVRRKILASDLASEVDRYDSAELMLDAIAGEPKTEDLLYEAIAYAVLHVHSESNRIIQGGIRSEESISFEEDLDEQIQALENVVPFALGWASQSGQVTGGAFASTMHAHD